MDTPEKNYLTELVTGDDGTPLYEQIKAYPLQNFPDITTRPHPISGEIYARPFIMSYISGQYMRQFMHSRPPRTA